MPTTAGPLNPFEQDQLEKLAKWGETTLTQPDDALVGFEAKQAADLLDWSQRAVANPTAVTKPPDAKMTSLQERAIELLPEMVARADDGWAKADDAERLKRLNRARREYGLRPADTVPGPRGAGDVLHEKLVESPAELIPFAGAGVTIWKLADVHAAAERAKKDEATTEDWETLVGFLEHNVEQARGATFGGMVADIATESVPFAIEFGLTAGMVPAAKAGAKAVGRKLGVQMVRKAAAEAVERTLARRLAGWAGDAAIGTAARLPAFSPRIVAEAFEHMTPGYVVVPGERDTLKQIVTQEGDDFGPALLKGTASIGIELLSEQTGEALNLAGGALFQRIMRHHPTAERVKSAMLGKLKEMKGYGSLAETADFLKRYGWHGIIAEMGEERVADVLRYAVRLDEDLHVPDLTQLGAEATAFGLTGGALRGIAYGATRLMPPPPQQPGERFGPRERPPVPPAEAEQPTPAEAVVEETEAGAEGPAAPPPLEPNAPPAPPPPRPPDADEPAEPQEPSAPPPPPPATPPPPIAPGEYGTVEAPNRLRLAEHFRDQLAAGARYERIDQARAEAATLLGGTIAADSPAAKTIDEAIEYGVVQAARRITEANRTGAPAEVNELLHDLYMRQPNLSKRTSQSVLLQQYSTPIHIGHLMQHLAGVDTNTSVYDPTAGQGALFTAANPAQVIANELDDARADVLDDQGFETTRVDATEYTPDKKVDAVLTNPPFGKRGRDTWLIGKHRTPYIDHAIAWKALDAMKPGGRAVLLVGGPPSHRPDGERKAFYRNEHRAHFWWNLYNRYNVVGHVTLAGDLYSRQGASFPTDLVVIEGAGKSQQPYPQQAAPRVIENYGAFKELFNADALKRPVEPGGREPGALDSEEPPAPDTGSVQQPPGAEGGQPGPEAGDQDRGSVPGRGGRRGPRSQPGPRTGGQPGGAGAGAAGTAGGAGATGAGGTEPGSRAGGSAAGGGRRETGEGTDAGGMAGGGAADVLQPGLTADLRGATPEQKQKIEELRQRLRAALDQKAGGAGTAQRPAAPIADREVFTAGVELGQALLEAGIADFGTFARNLVELVGPDILPHVKPIYAGVYAAADAQQRAPMTEFSQFIDLTDEQVAELARPVAPPVDTTAPPDTQPQHDADGNEYQTPYTPRSSGTAQPSFIPIMQAGAVRRALDTLEAEVGDISQYVADELGIDTARLHRVLYAGQIDAMGLAIRQARQRRAFVFGDQTGMGKGRTLALMMHWARRNGLIPVFVTAKPALYGDMARDWKNTEIWTPGTPFPVLVTNKNLRGKDAINLPDDSKLMSYGDQDAVLREAIGNVISDGRLKASVTRGGKAQEVEFDAIFSTYPQMQTVKGALTNRQRLLPDLMPRAFLILDESHKALGSAEKKEGEEGGGWSDKDTLTRARFIRELVQNAGGVAYASATWLKHPEVMDLYNRTDLGLLGSSDQIVEVAREGGVALMQVLSDMVAESGQYIRREHDLSGVAINPIQLNADLDRAGAISNIIGEVYWFDSYVESVVDQLNTIGQAHGGGQSNIESASFYSKLHNWVGQILLANKIDPLSDHAVELLKAGQKPFVALSNTMESFLDRYVATHDVQPGDTINITFRDMALDWLESARTVKEKGPQERTFRLTDEDLGRYGVDIYNRVRDVIMSAESLTALPVSPIDWFRHRMAKAGYTVGEVSGRKSRLEYNEDGSAVYAIIPGEETGDAGAQRVVNGYNGRPGAAPYDAVVGTRSAAEGLSLHASPENGLDLRPRAMLFAQADPDISVFIQMAGRVNRIGQVAPPSYHILMTDIPAETRPAAILLKKLALLSANVTANRESSLRFADVSDFINHIGDRVVADIMEENPEWHRRLGQPLKENDHGDLLASGAARKVSGRAVLLPIADQQRLFEEITQGYNERMDQYRQMGIDPLGSPQLDLQAKTLQTTPIVPAGATNSPFHATAAIETIEMKRQGKPFQAAHVIDMVAQALDGKTQAEWARDIAGEVGTAWQDYRSQREAAFVADMEARGIAPRNQDEQLARYTRGLMVPMEHFEAFVSQYPVGASVVLTERDTEEVYAGVITSMRRVGQVGGDSPASPRKWRVTAAVADAAREVHFTIAQTYAHGDRPPAMAIERATPDALRILYGTDDIYEAFDKTIRASTEVRQVVTGNIPAAISSGVHGGRIIQFSRADGTFDRGLLLPRKFNSERYLAERPISFRTVHEIFSFLERVPTGTVRSKDGVAFIHSIARRGRAFSLATSRTGAGKKLMKNRALLDAVRDEAPDGFVTSGSMAKMELTGPTAKQAAQVLMDQGFVFEVFGERGRAEASEIVDGNRKTKPASPAPQRAGSPAIAKVFSLPATAGIRPVSAAQILDAIRRIAKSPLTHGHGWFAQLKVAALYDVRNDYIALAEANDVVRGLHEMGHAIHAKIVDWDATLPADAMVELHDLGKQLYGPRKPAGGYAREGMAEFVARWMLGENPLVFAPATYRYIQTDVIPRAHGLKENLTRLRELVERYDRQGALARVEQAVSKTGKPADLRTLSERARALVNTIAHTMDDRFRHLEEAMQKARAQLGPDAMTVGEDAYNMARTLLGNGAHVAWDAVRDGPKDLVTGERLAEGIEEELRGLTQFDRERLQLFVDFIFAQHARDVWAEGKNPRISLTDANYVYNALKDTPGFAEASRKITAWSKAHIEMLRRVGVLSDKAAKAITETFEFYIPLKRVMDRWQGGGGRGSAFSGRSGVKGMSDKGSGRDILDPLLAMVMQSADMYNLAIEVQVENGIIRLARENEGMAWLAHQVQGPLDAFTVKAAEAIEQLEKKGALVEGVDGNELLTFFRAGRSYRGTQSIVPHWENGKLTWWRIDPDVRNEFAAVAPKNHALYLRVLHAIFREGATFTRLGIIGLSAAWGIFRNPARDMPVALMHTEHGWFKDAMLLKIPIQGIGYSIANVWTFFQNMRGKRGDPMIEFFRAYGGQLASLQMADAEQTYKHLRDTLNNRGGTSDVARFIMKHPVHTLQELFSSTDIGMRIPEVRETLRKAGVTPQDLRSGKAVPLDVAVEALLNGHEATMDFRRKGAFFKWYGKYKAFVSPKYQGPVQALRKAGIRGTNPAYWESKRMVRQIMRATALFTVPRIIYWFLVKDEDWYKELDPFWKLTCWNFNIGGKVVSIPGTFDYGIIFGGIPEMLLNTWYNDDPAAVQQWWRESRRQFLPDPAEAIPDTLLPALEVNMGARGYGTFSDRPIEAPWMATVEPRDRAYDWTSSASRYVANMLSDINIPTSPAKLDHLVRGYFGTVGYGLWRAPDEGLLPVLGFGGVARSEVSSRTVSVDAFYERRENIRQRHGSAKLRGPVEPVLAQALRQFDAYADVMTDLRKLEDRDTRNALITGVARQALGHDPLPLYPNLFRATDLPDEAAAIRDRHLTKYLRVATTSPPNKKDVLDGLLRQSKGAPVLRSALDAAWEERRREWAVSRDYAASMLRESGMDETHRRRQLADLMRRAGLLTDNRWINLMRALRDQEERAQPRPAGPLLPLPQPGPADMPAQAG